MEEAANATPGAMAAMMGGTDEAVRNLAEECGIDVANFNAPGQIVVSGSESGVDQAVAGAKAAGIRVAKKLEVAGAYHSRMMQSAQDQLEPELAEAALTQPSIPVICNVDARPVEDVDDIRQTLARQVTGSVRWAESMRFLLDRGHTTFLELGPGGILTGLMRRIERSATVFAVGDQAGIDAAAEALG